MHTGKNNFTIQYPQTLKYDSNRIEFVIHENLPQILHIEEVEPSHRFAFCRQFDRLFTLYGIGMDEHKNTKKYFFLCFKVQPCKFPLKMEPSTFVSHTPTFVLLK